MESRRSIFISGAGQGIGRAIAERFARQGWFVGVYDIQSSAVQALAEMLGPDNSIAGSLDVTDPAGWRQSLEAFWDAAGGRLDVLVNNAGVLASGPFQDIALRRHHQIVDVNLKGVINGCHLAFPWLQKTPGARVINLASASAIYGAADLASYSATKFAVRGLTEALDLEWSPLGIKVCDIWPIFVKTAMTDELRIASFRRLGASLDPADVSNAVWKAANHGGAHRVHWRVGAQTRALYQAVCFLPDRLHRALTARLGGH